VFQPCVSCYLLLQKYDLFPTYTIICPTFSFPLRIYAGRGSGLPCCRKVIRRLGKHSAPQSKTPENASKSYFHDVKINFHALKIDFHDLKIDFHVMKIVFPRVAENFPMRPPELYSLLSGKTT